MLRPRRPIGPLAVLAFVLAFLFGAQAWARAPEPGDEVQITLHDGNTVVGELLGLSESGYRVSFGGMEVIVAYPSVRGIEVLVEDSLLEEMRPGPSDDPRGRSEGTYGQPAPSAPPAPPPPPMRAPQRAAPPPSTAPDPTPPSGHAAPPRGHGEPPPARAAPSPTPEQQTNLDVPPKPRSRGGGLMVSGFILLGAGTGVAVGSAMAFEDGGLDSRESFFLPALTLTGGIIATAGMAMGITGVILKSVSGSRRRRWEREYGGLDFRPESLAVMPTVTPDGSGGLALVGAF